MTVSDNARIFAAALAKMVSPMAAEDATKAIVVLLSACTDINDAVFGNPPALAMKFGRELERVPTLAKLRKLLEAEAKLTGPKAPALPYPDEDALSDADRIWISTWGKKSLGASVGAAANLLGTIRQYAPSAFDILTRDNVEGADVIACERGWEPSWRTKQRLSMEWSDPETIRTSIMRIQLIAGLELRGQYLRTLRAAVDKHAPEYAWVVEEALTPPAPPVPAPAPSAVVPFQPRPAPKPAPAQVTIEATPEPESIAARWGW